MHTHIYTWNNESLMLPHIKHTNLSITYDILYDDIFTCHFHIIVIKYFELHNYCYGNTKFLSPNDSHECVLIF